VAQLLHFILLGAGLGERFVLLALGLTDRLVFLPQRGLCVSRAVLEGTVQLCCL
jgi:hypothetical protein